MSNGGCALAPPRLEVRCVEQRKYVRAKNQSAKSGKQKGRGAYLCAACLKNPVSIKKRPLDRAFRQKVEDEVYEALFGKEI